MSLLWDTEWQSGAILWNAADGSDTGSGYTGAVNLTAFGGGGGKELRELIDRIKKDAEALYEDLASPKLKPKSPAAKPVEKNLLPQLNALEARVKSLQSELKALQHEKAVLAQLDADAEEEAVVTMLLL